jgi:hypothetical protein
MEENKIEVKNENCEAKKGHCFGFKCHGGADCDTKCHKIIKFGVIILIALALLGVGIAIGRHSERGERGGRFNRFDRPGISQEGSGCGAQGNFRGVGRGQRGTQEINQDQPVNQAGNNQAVDNQGTNNQFNNRQGERGTMRGGDANVDAQVNGNTGGVPTLTPSNTQVTPTVTSTQTKPATQVVPAK